MPFGGAPCPSEFALAADLIADTTNDLPADTRWNHKKVFSDMIHKIPARVPILMTFLLLKLGHLVWIYLMKNMGRQMFI